MAHNELDPLETQDPHTRARQRLRINLATTLLLDWLVSDVESREPDYFSDLESRFQTGFDYAAKWRDDPKFDGFVPLHGRDGSTIDFWLHRDDLDELLSRLFPHGPNDAPAFNQGRGFVVVMLHSALEALFYDLGLKTKKRESIVSAWVRILDIAEREPALASVLVDLGESRNLLAHNGGRGTERYRRHVPLTTFAIGQTRLVTGKDIRIFSDAIHRVADQALSMESPSSQT